MHDDLACIGLRLDASNIDERVRGCRLLPLASPVRVTSTQDSDHGVVGVVGWASDEVDRLVWESPDSNVAIELHTHPGMPVQVLATAARLDRLSVVRAYDAAGNPLGGAGVTGAGE